MQTGPHPPAPRWLAPVFAAMLLLGGSAVAAWSIELPYYAFSPGPVGDAIDAISVEPGVDVYTPDGELFVLTVALQEVNAYEMVAAAVDPRVDLVPQERIKPPEETDEEFRRRSLDQMDQSKESAIGVALNVLGIDPERLAGGVRVADVLPDAPAANVLAPEDVIVNVDGQDIAVVDDVRSALEGKVPGDRVDLGVARGGDQLDLEVELYSQPDDPDRPLIGILITTVFPIDIDSTNIGGPSAGMMYTLAIIDLLSDGDLARGHVIAGTGTIQPDGTVGPIGGIRQKVAAAEAAGAEYIMVPSANYPDALTAFREQIDIVEVGSIDDALAFLEGLPHT